jgi:hypothetical protein
VIRSVCSVANSNSPYRMYNLKNTSHWVVLHLGTPHFRREPEEVAGELSILGFAMLCVVARHQFECSTSVSGIPVM